MPNQGRHCDAQCGGSRDERQNRVRYRTDKSELFIARSVKVGFEPAALQQNLEALISDLKKIKPSAAKGIYVRKITVSTTMGPGLHGAGFIVNLDS